MRSTPVIHVMHDVQEHVMFRLRAPLVILPCCLNQVVLTPSSEHVHFRLVFISEIRDTQTSYN